MGEYSNLDRSLELEEDGLRDEYLSRFRAQMTDLRLQQLHLFTRPTSPDFQQSVYDRVEVDVAGIGHVLAAAAAAAAVEGFALLLPLPLPPPPTAAGAYLATVR